jgi:hypothetical protein
MEAAGGFEPPNNGFADRRLNHLATPPAPTLTRGYASAFEATGWIVPLRPGSCSGCVSHWITSSARASTEGGMVRPSALAVRRFRMNSNLLGS